VTILPQLSLAQPNLAGQLIASVTNAAKYAVNNTPQAYGRKVMLNAVGVTHSGPLRFAGGAQSVLGHAAVTAA
jgi:hypothetical protein